MLTMRARVVANVVESHDRTGRPITGLELEAAELFDGGMATAAVPVDGAADLEPGGEYYFVLLGRVPPGQ